MVRAVLPTPPSPNTTSLYKVIFPCDILNQVCLLEGSLCAVQPCARGTSTSQVGQRGCLMPPQIAGVTSLSGRGHVNRPSVSPEGEVPDQRASPAGRWVWLGKRREFVARRTDERWFVGSRQTDSSQVVVKSGGKGRRGSYRQLVIQPKLACLLWSKQREVSGQGRAAVQSR